MVWFDFYLDIRHGHVPARVSTSRREHLLPSRRLGWLPGHLGGKQNRHGPVRVGSTLALPLAPWAGVRGRGGVQGKSSLATRAQLSTVVRRGAKALGAVGTPRRPRVPAPCSAFTPSCSPEATDRVRRALGLMILGFLGWCLPRDSPLRGFRSRIFTGYERL